MDILTAAKNVLKTVREMSDEDLNKEFNAAKNGPVALAILGEKNMSETNAPEYNTFVFRGKIDDSTNVFNSQFCGLEPRAWSAGHALRDKNDLEEFVQAIINDEFVDLDEVTEQAEELMERLNFS